MPVELLQIPATWGEHMGVSDSNPSHQSPSHFVAPTKSLSPSYLLDIHLLGTETEIVNKNRLTAFHHFFLHASFNLTPKP